MTENTLGFIQKTTGIWKFDVKSFQANLILERIIPNTWNVNREHLEFEINLQNIKYLKMVINEYPLLVTDKKRWNECLSDLKTNNNIKQKLKELNYAEPNELSFNGKLMKFQKQGLDFLLKTNGNALLADEMGLGKTVQSIAFLATAKDTLPVIVISTLVTLWNWQNELKKFFRVKQKQGLMIDELIEPTISIIRSGKHKPLKKSDVYIINYELIGKRLDDLIGINPKTIICDEVQNLRNISTVKFQAIDQISKIPSVKHRISLSGTPMYNKGSEMWGIVDILQRGLLGSYENFKKTYCNAWTGKVEQSKQNTLFEILRDNVMLRRKKIDVLHDLPDKNRLQQRIEIDENYYQSELDKMFSKINDAKLAIESAHDDIKKIKIMELAKSYTSSIQQERQVAGISKAPYIVEYIKELMDIDEKIVVFVHHIAVHEILMRGLSEFHPLQIIGGQKDTQRQHAIDKFQNDKNYKLIICGIRAGNVGINLTAASYVIFGELDWSPSVHKQAEDRLHRIGQKKPVFAHYLIGNNTMDETISGKLTDKALEIDAVLGDEIEKLDNEKSTKILEQIHNRIKSKSKSKIRTLMYNN